MTDIVLNQLSKTWGITAVVDRISFSVKAGSFAVLLGPSGCGKSTTLRMLAGLDLPSGGSIAIGGRDVTHATPAQRNLSMVFQSYALFPHLDVRNNILFGLKVRKEPAADYDKRLNRVVDMLSLGGLLERKPGQLSGGQQQRVSLARAIIAETPVCLMDEPLSNLDAKLRQEMRRDIRDLQRKLGVTMVYVTHDQTEAMSMADQVILMRAGRIEQDGTPEELYSRPATTFAATFIGTPPTNIFPANDGLIIGVRPEHIRIVESGGVQGSVVGNEYLGADTLVTCEVPAQGGEAPWRIVAKLPGRQEPAQGISMRLGWDAQYEHRFDSTSGARIRCAESSSK
jgi:sn-glycerol 3-phosphate transport system ATP-binding protein